MIVRHGDRETDQTCSNGATVTMGTYNIETNKIGSVTCDVTIIDLGNGATGTGKFVCGFHRYGGAASTVIDSTDALIPLKTPGVLAGSSVSFSQSSNTITVSFTGVAGRNIRVICLFQLTTITD